MLIVNVYVHYFLSFSQRSIFSCDMSNISCATGTIFCDTPTILSHIFIIHSAMFSIYWVNNYYFFSYNHYLICQCFYIFYMYRCCQASIAMIIILPSSLYCHGRLLGLMWWDDKWHRTAVWLALAKSKRTGLFHHHLMLVWLHLVSI